MDDRTKPHDAPASEVGTTGHEWDGIHELNMLSPRWWLWLLYATIVWAVGYWILYPAWPLVSSYTGGALNWHARSAVASDVAALKQAQRGPMMAKLAAASLQQIETTPELLDFSRALGGRAFADNCAPCHGAGGGGAKGYPNLTDDDWLWGGTLDAISQTITHGARSGDDDGHQGSMPAFGRDGHRAQARRHCGGRRLRPLAVRTVDAALGADLKRGAKSLRRGGPDIYPYDPVLNNPQRGVYRSIPRWQVWSRWAPPCSRTTTPSGRRFVVEEGRTPGQRNL